MSKKSKINQNNSDTPNVNTEDKIVTSSSNECNCLYCQETDRIYQEELDMATKKKTKKAKKAKKVTKKASKKTTRKTAKKASRKVTNTPVVTESDSTTTDAKIELIGSIVEHILGN